MSLFMLTDDGLAEIERTTFRDAQVHERYDLQRVLRENIDVIAEDVIVISEEFSEWEDSSRRIDLLGVDTNGALVVIELKRTQDGGFMDLQALRYAAMISAMRFDRAVEVFRKHLARMGRGDEDPRALLLEHLVQGEDDFGKSVRMVLASMDFSKELTTTVMWLNLQGLDLRCVRLCPYTLDGRVLLDVQQVIPLPEAAEYMVQLKEKAIEERRTQQERTAGSPFWYVNVGMDSADIPETDGRHWHNCRKHGYLLAGGGPRYSSSLKKLQKGDPIFAYVKSRVGYVGFGIVAGEPTPAHELVLADGKKLEAHLGPIFSHCNRPGNEPDWEWGVRVDWKTTVPLHEGKRFDGIFANQNIVCRLTHAATLQYLATEFGVDLDTYSPRARRPDLDFLEMGIPVGSTLQNGGATVTVVAPRKVSLDGEELSLTAATARLFQDSSPSRRGQWTFKGQPIRGLYDKTYGAS